MAQLASRYCRSCDCQRQAEWSGPNHGLHFVLSLLTAGFWLWIWLGLALFTGQWTCRECGSRCASASRPSFIGQVATLIFWLFALAFFGGLGWLAWRVNHKP